MQRAAIFLVCLVSLFLAVGGSSDRLAALSGGTVDATPLDVAYLQRTEQLGLSSVVYLGDVVDLRLGGLAVATEKNRQES